MGKGGKSYGFSVCTAAWGDSDRGRKKLRKLQEEVGVGAEERA